MKSAVFLRLNHNREIYTVSKPQPQTNCPKPQLRCGFCGKILKNHNHAGPYTRYPLLYSERIILLHKCITKI